MKILNRVYQSELSKEFINEYERLTDELERDEVCVLIQGFNFSPEAALKKVKEDGVTKVIGRYFSREEMANTVMVDFDLFPDFYYSVKARFGRHWSDEYVEIDRDAIGEDLIDDGYVWWLQDCNGNDIEDELSNRIWYFKKELDNA